MPFVSADVWLPLVSLTGLCAGFFANRCIDRLPYDLPLLERSSTCATCGRGDAALDGVLWLASLSRQFRCSRCRSEVRATTVLVTALMPALWVLLALRHGPSPRTAGLLLLVTFLLVLAVIDFHHYILPDAVTIPGTVAGIMATMVPGWPVTLLDACLSAGCGYFGMMALAKAAESYYGEEALGQGDWKMVAMLGAAFGSTRLILVIIGANALGAACGLSLIAMKGAEGRQRLPLGTFLGAVAIGMAFF